ncbi:Cullin-associated NEDD8-dissociated protein 1 [Armadillidium vulgare]|nr:Cullin-associated NEDD8-dissociated protein 1 [Armadillidium vulgare]
MTSSDKDYRFMATNDLILGPLVNKVKELHVYSIVEALCDHMMSDKEQLRDMSSLALKTVINELPSSSTSLVGNICKRVTDKLSEAIVKFQDDVSIQLEALDILGDLLSRFGSLLVSFHPQMIEALLPQLSSPRLAVRKRTIVALSYLVISCSPSIYAKLMNYLIDELSKNKSTSMTRTYIQCISAISRQAGHKFGEYLERVMPLVIQYVAVNDDELREYCISACDSFTLRCPKEITLHLPVVRRASAKCLEAVISTRHEMLMDFYKTVSPMLISRFKEREENVKVDIFNAYISLLRQTKPSVSLVIDPDAMEQEEGTISMLKQQVPSLVKAVHRQMREKSIKTRQGCFALLSELINVYPGALTHHIPALIPGIQFSLGDKNSSSNMKIETLAFVNCLLQYHSGEIFHSYIKDILPPIVTCVGDPFYKITSEALLVLQQIVKVIRPLDQPSSFDFTVYTGDLYHCTLARLKAADLDQEVKERAISTMGQIITHLGDHLQSELGTCFPIFLDRLRNEITRLTTVKALTKIASSPLRIDLKSILAESFPILGSFLRKNQRALKLATLTLLDALVNNYYTSITPPMLEKVDQPSSFDFTVYTGDLYHCTLARLKAADLDQEVKERAISTMGQIITHLGDHLQSELGTCFPIFLDRLRNEITRLTTVKALTKIASSPLRIDLKSILAESFPILGSFLRKNQRALKLATLTLLDALVNNYYTSITPPMLEKVLIELPGLVTETDLHVAQLSLTLLTSIATLHKESLRNFVQAFMPCILNLVKSPLLQGGALKSMQDLFEAIVKVEVAGLSYKNLLTEILDPIFMTHSPNIHKQAYHSMAKCVAALTITQPGEAFGVVNKFLMEIQASRSPAAHSFSLLAIGEIGKHTDLSHIPNLKEAVVESFGSTSEEVKSAASYSLGHLSCGNLQEHLPFVLAEIENNPKRQYLLLHSLKEIINFQSKSEEGVKVLQGYVGHIWDQLFQHAECQEEGTRNVVAECLGKLTLINPSQLLPKLQEALRNNSPMMRTTVVTAIKFTISDQPSPIELLSQLDLNVRRVALVAFNSAAHNKPSLKELVYEVEMGPFKHPVDDGLDIRKAAFECMYTILETCLDRIDIYVFLEHVESGLKDHYDIKMLTYLMLARLAHLCPQAVLQRLDRLIEPVRTTVTSKVKANSVKQEYEKQDELKRSAMRAISALLAITDADKNPQLNDFMNQIRATADLKELYDSIQKDSCTYNEASMDLS